MIARTAAHDCNLAGGRGRGTVRPAGGRGGGRDARGAGPARLLTASPALSSLSAALRVRARRRPGTRVPGTRRGRRGSSPAACRAGPAARAGWHRQRARISGSEQPRRASNQPPSAGCHAGRRGRCLCRARTCPDDDSALVIDSDETRNPKQRSTLSHQSTTHTRRRLGAGRTRISRMPQRGAPVGGAAAWLATMCTAALSESRAGPGLGRQGRGGCCSWPRSGASQP